jgi:hypothetical protein
MFNPDVADAVRRGEWSSGQAHHAARGAEEIDTGRRLPLPDYREMSYLLRNPDVLHALRTGKISSGRMHWEQHGHKEERAGARKPYVSLEPKHAWTPELRRNWQDGYLQLPKFFSDAEVESVNDCVDRLWRDRARDGRPIDVDYFLDAAPWCTAALKDVPDEARRRPHKVNNLYYWEEAVRRMVLDERLAAVVRLLLDGDPCALTTLNFELGSQQMLHQDTLYMPPAIPYRMVAAWVALEDISPEAGPLTYVPGSNRIPPYFFTTGRLGWHGAPEMPQFEAHMKRHVAERGLRQVEFCARKGDVFIWHPLLYHGGTRILDRTKTRKSLVTHYFAAADYPLGNCDNVSNVITYGSGRYYENRIVLTVRARPEQLSWPAAA